MRAASAPTTDELKAWYAKNTKLFEMAPRLSFRHLYFSPDHSGQTARADAEAALVALEGQPETLPDGSAPGDRFMFQDYYGERTPQVTAREFGPQFAQELSRLPTGSWQELARVEVVEVGRGTFKQIRDW